MLYLNKETVEKLFEHSKRRFPEEVCGILAGNGERVEKAYEMTNTDTSRTTFFMDPKEQLRVMKEIRNSGLEMVGIYHSHPDTEAYPSRRDVELAHYPEALYVIISLKDRSEPGIRAFRIIEGEVREEAIGKVG